MYRWQGSTWKDAPRHMSSGNGRAGQWSIPAHLFQEPNPKHQTTPSAAKRVNQQKSPVGVDRKAKSRGTLEDRLAVSYQAKHSLTMQTINHAHRHSLEGTENSCPHTTCTWMFIAASFRLDKNQKQPWCPSVGKWINIHPMEYYSAIRKKWVNRVKIYSFFILDAKKRKKKKWGTSLVVQWLRLYSQCRGPRFDPWSGNY